MHVGFNYVEYKLSSLDSDKAVYTTGTFWLMPGERGRHFATHSKKYTVDTNNKKLFSTIIYQIFYLISNQKKRFN